MSTVAPPPPAPEPPTKGRLVRATLAALGLAAVVLVTVVLPAEYGVDPLGTGEALGLVVLSDPVGGGEIPVRSDGLTAQSTSYAIDQVHFDLEPGDEVEYKYRLAAGAAMLYAWSATGPVRSEMHSEGDGARAGTAEFFEVEEASLGRNGSYVAPFPGVHGWYWVNQGEGPVTVTLHASGFFDKALEYHPPDGPVLRRIESTPADRPDGAGADPGR